MKKILMTAVTGVLLLLTGCSFDEPEVQPMPGTEQTLPVVQEEPQALSVGDKLPVSRGLAAKMIALAFDDKNAIRLLDREITFLDTEEGDWFDKYINAVVVQGFMAGTDSGLFLPEEPVTIAQAQVLLDAVNPASGIKIKIDDDNRDKAISYALWCQLYRQALEAMALAESQDIETFFDIEETSFVVLASHGNNPVLPEGSLITDQGPYSCEGLSGDPYIDMEVTVLEKNDEIIAILTVDSQEPVIHNAYVVETVGNQITIFSGGAERVYTGSSGEIGDVQAGAICDIQIQGSKVLGVSADMEQTRGKILRVTEDVMEIQGVGTIPLSEEFKIYSTAEGPVKWKAAHNLTVGRDIARIVVAEGSAQAAVIDTVVSPETIRVALGTSDFGGLIHEQVLISATSAFTVEQGGNVKSYSAGEEVAFQNPLEMYGRAYVKAGDGGKITVRSIERNGSNPQYRGDIEVAAQNGGFTLINEVGLEEYLYSVVPSEMPVSYGIEALKVQAITARSYAYNQFYANKYHPYGANVDDSVLSQVYNNVSETDIANRAVDETAGLCLTYDGGVISANFFSTSSGMTANGGEVWANAITKEFPTATSPYLTSSRQYSGMDYGDLSQEENAAAFFKDWDVTGFDSDVSWFRWQFEMTREELSASINANLKQRYEADSTMIKTLQPDGMFRSKPVETIGELTNIEVLRRGAGGNVMTLRLTGTENTVLVHTEYNIRTLLRPQSYLEDGQDVSIQRKDGTQLLNYSLIPSGFFTLERLTDHDGSIVSVRFTGGGNGHGVGMSQNGVKGMIDSGYTYEEVLKYYYNGTEVQKMYE